MSVMYKFSSMQSFSDYFANMATEVRNRGAKNKKEQALNKLEAATLDYVAHTIRNTTIEAE